MTINAGGRSGVVSWDNHERHWTVSFPHKGKQVRISPFRTEADASRFLINFLWSKA